MPKPKGKKKISSEKDVEIKTVFKDADSEEYAIVVKTLGSGRFLVRLNMQKKEIIGRLSGGMRRGRKNPSNKNWVAVGSVVLVGIRSFQADIVDIVHVYDNKEIKALKNDGLLMDTQVVVDDVEFVEEVADEEFDFEDI